ncbi:MAG: hypothetical protein IPP91_05035 [Betaproteobacteria bacterium]|nr:hypothetical protein [Betaproteobacteria bacterium]
MSEEGTRRGFLAGAFAALGSAQALASPASAVVPPREATRRNPIIDVLAFGAEGDGKVDDTAAFRAALLAAAGRSLLVPTPKVAYRITGTLRVSEGTMLVGESRYATRIRLDADFPLISLGAWAGLVSLHLDGNGRAGVGVSMTGTEGQQFVENCRITDFGAPCLHFSLGAGSGFSCASALAYRRDGRPGGGRAAIVIEDAVQLHAVPRKFVNLETGGQCSFSFGGGNSTYVANSFLSDLEYSRHSTATLITNCRIATPTPLVIRGGQNCVVACDVYPRVTLAEGTGGCVVGPNNYNNPPVIDQSGNNQNLIFCPDVPYAPELSNTSGTVALGNGSITGRWSRQGNVVSAAIRLVTGTTTFLGSGRLRFSLPPGMATTNAIPAPCGQLRVAHGDAVAWANLYRPAGAAYAEAERSDAAPLLPGGSAAWPPGTVFDLSIRLSP